MKKILYIAAQDLNQRRGGSLASLAYYNALKHLYGDMVSLMIPEESATGQYANAIKVPKRSRLKAVLSFSWHRHKEFVNQYLKKHESEYDICVINGGFEAGDMMNMIHRHGLKIIVIHHNFAREYHMGNKTIFTLNGLTPFFVNRLERMAYSKADANCFLTQQDCHLLKDYYGQLKSPSFILYVFEPSPINCFEASYVTKPLIAITGSMNSYQTMCGIGDLHLNYYNIIQELCPNWDLVIAGRNPQKEVYDLQNENKEHIIVIPNPPVMDDVTKPASVFLCPTNVGGGIKLRVMDGLRQGLPILVHQVSARGYDVFFGKPYFKIYNDSNSFRSGLEDLLSYCSNGLDKSFIQKEYVKYFGFEVGCERIKKVVEAVRGNNVV